MNEYNFLNLSSFEFENFSRDILQEKLGLFFESFTSGQDGGIDLRSSLNLDENIIVQAKRYTRFNDLKSTLNTEIDKVKELNPTRYILITSVGLTPDNKDIILQLFGSYIHSTEDILGRDDLNNLLGLYPKIEEKYYKLWLSSTNILNKLINSTVYNQSKFELDEIKESLKVYVQNESFNEAIGILKKNNYVIISGIPGIGKTTLSRMLAYRLLAEDFDDFVYVADSINDAYSYYEDGKKQVFFFDDFLGKNFLETGLKVNEDSKLIKFIDRIKNSKNKILILATREYILKQAKNSFESLNTPSLDLVKCTLDLSKYTKIIRAEILFNHLFFADIPLQHLRNLIETKSYRRLIDHTSYNPRIIETFVKNQFWENCEPKEFSKNLISFFDNPESVWLHAFENTISKGSQITLLVLSTLGTPTFLEDLKISINSFITANITKYPLTIDSIEFRKIIKELESTFISTKMDSNRKIAVEFQNPSIQDFLINYIDGNYGLIIDLIKSFSFVSQFFRIFTFDQVKKEYNKRIILDKKILKEYVSKILIDFDIFKTSYIFRLNYSESNTFTWWKNEEFFYSFLNQILIEVENASNEELKKFVIEKFNQNIQPKKMGYSERRAYVDLIGRIGENQINYDGAKLISNFAEHVNTIDSLKDFSKLKKVFSTQYEEYTITDDFNEKFQSVIQNEIENTAIEKYKSLIEELKEIELDFDYLLYDEISELTQKHDAYEAKIDAKFDMSDYEYEAREYEQEIEREEQYISDLFDGLMDE